MSKEWWSNQSASTPAPLSLFMEEMEALYPDKKCAIKSKLKDLMCHWMYKYMMLTSTYINRLYEVRAIATNVGLFPPVHGLAFFTCGQTQVAFSEA